MDNESGKTLPGAKHTSGPWTAARGPQGGFAISAPHIDRSAHGTALICQRAPWPHRVEESEANARLLAAAPDMLEALKYVRDWLCYDGPVKDDGITHPVFGKANNAVHAAIAKATTAGRSTS